MKVNVIKNAAHREALKAHKFPEPIRMGLQARVTPLEGGRVEHVISTEAVDRHDSTVSAGGWELDSYRANPVVLFAHNASDLPIGRSVEIRVDGPTKSLISITEFAPRDLNPFADMVGKMVRGGFLPGVSVGFIPLDYVYNEERDDGSSWFPPVDYLRQELAEYSIVPVPSNPEALAKARSTGIDTAPLREYAERILAGEHGAGLWLSRATLEHLALSAVPPKMVSIPAERGGALARADAPATCKCAGCTVKDCGCDAPMQAAEPAKAAPIVLPPAVTAEQIAGWTADSVRRAEQQRRMKLTGKVD